MKKLTAILFSLFVFGLSAQDTDSLSTVIQNKIQNKIFRQFMEQGVFEFQGKTLPSFKLTQLGGSEFDSNKLLGKPTLINFWFTSCAPCLEEIPILNRIETSYSDKINFIAITFESSNDILSFLESKPYNFVQLVLANNYLKELDVKTYPRTLITDENLVVRFMDELKPKDFDKFEIELRSQIEKLLRR